MFLGAEQTKQKPNQMQRVNFTLFEGIPSNINRMKLFALFYQQKKKIIILKKPLRILIFCQSYFLDF